MNKVARNTYSAYSPRAFTKAERGNVVLLFGGLNWRAERALEGILRNSGHRARALPTPKREDLLRGRELADIGQCCPTTFTTGNLANFLEGEAARTGKEAVTRDYVYVTAGSCGSCRFGQYHQSYEMALRNLGMESFRMFLMSQSELDQSGGADAGLQLDPPLLLKASYGVLAADVLQDLEYQIRPYEVSPGATDRAVRLAVEELYEACLKVAAPNGTWSAVLWALTDRHFAAVEVDRLRVKPMVKITGEFYLQTVEGDPNYNIHAWLEDEGAEVYPAAVAVWLDYLIRHAGQYYEEREGLVPRAGLKLAAFRAISRVYRWRYDKLRRAMGGAARPMPQQSALRAFAAPFYDHRLSGGEGDMLVGKAIWAHLRKKAHMICELSPYSCMPNTMSVGAMAAVQGRYPDLLYAPLEIKGDSEVHALSRCQMVLTEAKNRAREEFDRALKAAGLTLDEARARLDRTPAMKSALRRPRNRGAAGTAANLVLELGGARL